MEDAAAPAQQPDAAVSASTASGPTVDEAAILASVANGAYRNSAQFLPMNGDAYPSAAAAGSSVNVWVSWSDFTDYSKIAPENKGSGATVQPGTLIIREVLDATGAVTKVTLMMKGPVGYNPDLDDFWWGVTAPDGTPMVDNGVKQLGKLQQCYSCHLTRATDGYLFGVPMADRKGAPKGDAGVAAAPDGGVVAPSHPDAGACGNGNQDECN
jgi:hypothetical protein